MHKHVRFWPYHVALWQKRGYAWPGRSWFPRSNPPVRSATWSLALQRKQDILNEFVKLRTRTRVSWCRRTGVELLVDKASDLFELLEVGGLQEWEEVPHVGLLSGHGGGSAGGGGGTCLTVSVLACLEDSWGPPTNTVSRHLCQFRTRFSSELWSTTLFAHTVTTKQQEEFAANGTSFGWSLNR